MNLNTRLKTALRDLENRELFHELVRESMAVLHLEDGDVADKLPVSRSAVNRWRNGKTAPLPLMRKPVYKLFVRLAGG